MKKIFTLIAVAVLAFSAHADMLNVAETDATSLFDQIMAKKGVSRQTTFRSPGSAEYCQAPTLNYEYTGIEQATVTITNHEEGATLQIEVYKNSLDPVFTNSVTASQYSFDLSGSGGYIVIVTATKSDMLDSPIGALMFTIDGVVAPVETCLAPYVSWTQVDVGTYNLTVTNRESGATVYCEVYKNGLLFSRYSFTRSFDSSNLTGAGDYELRAVAKKSGYNDSPEGGMFFTINDDTAPLEPCATPLLTYAITGYEEATVTFTNREAGSRVYYEVYKGDVKVDQGSFTGSSYDYCIVDVGDYQVQAFATKSDMSNSCTNGIFFSIDDYSSNKCSAPSVTWQEVSYETNDVIITNNENGARVYYEVYKNGSQVDQGSFTGSSYDFYVVDDGEYIVYAYAKKSGKSNSSIGGGFFTILDGEAQLDQCLSPYVTWTETGVETTTVSFTNCESGARVYYEIYKDDVKVYQGSFTGSSYSYIVANEGNYRVSAVAKKTDMRDSNAAGVLFTIEAQEAPVENCLAPTATWAPTGYKTVTVTMTNRESGATVNYWVYRNDDAIDHGSFTGSSFNYSMTGPGFYQISCQAEKSGEEDSSMNIAFFYIVGDTGDVNNDDEVTIKDVTDLINYLLTGNIDGGFIGNGDCNGDREIGITDVTTLINYLLTGNWTH